MPFNKDVPPDVIILSIISDLISLEHRFIDYWIASMIVNYFDLVIYLLNKIYVALNLVLWSISITFPSGSSYKRS